MGNESVACVFIINLLRPTKTGLGKAGVKKLKKVGEHA